MFVRVLNTQDKVSVAWNQGACFVTVFNLEVIFDIGFFDIEMQTVAIMRPDTFF